MKITHKRITASVIPVQASSEVDDAFNDDWAAGIAAKFSVPYRVGEVIFNMYDYMTLTHDFNTVSSFLDYLEDHLEDDVVDRLIPLMTEDERSTIMDAMGWEDNDIESCSSIKGAIDTGLEYWYFTRHGLGPGMMPRGVNVIDTYEEFPRTWFKTDKLLTTEELKEYDIQEQWPPESAVTHNGDTISGCSSVTASKVTKVGEDEDTIEFNVVSDDIESSTKIEGGSDDKSKKIKHFIEWSIDESLDQTGERITKEDALNWLEDADFSSELIDGDTFDNQGITKDDVREAINEYFKEETPVEGSENIEAASIESYRGYKVASGIYNDTYDVLDNSYKLIKKGFPTERSARSYIDTELITSSENIVGATEDYDDDVYDEHSDMYVEPSDYADEVGISVHVDTMVELVNDGHWENPDYDSLAAGFERNDPFQEMLDYNLGDMDPMLENLVDVLIWYLPDGDGKYHLVADVILSYNVVRDNHDNLLLADFIRHDCVVNNVTVTPEGKVEDEPAVVVENSTDIKAVDDPFMTAEELNDAILEDRPFDLASFKKYHDTTPDNVIKAKELEVGDVVEITESAEEVNLGTVVKILAIDDPEDKDADGHWWDGNGELTFRVEIVKTDGTTVLNEGDVFRMHFFEDDYVGPLVLDEM